MQESHTTERFPKIRQASISLLNAARKKNMIHSLVEIDIEEGRAFIRKLRTEKSTYVSITGYIINAIAKVVAKNKMMHAYRNRKNQLIFFNDVDVSTTIERKFAGQLQVVPMIIRAADKKEVTEISQELKEEKEKPAELASVHKSMCKLLLIPPFFRQWIFRWMDRAPHKMKKLAGTIMVTSVPASGNGGMWGIPIGSHTLNITIGGVTKRLIKQKDEIVERDFICLTISADHDIIDGAPLGRFVNQLKKAIESPLNHANENTYETVDGKSHWRDK